MIRPLSSIVAAFALTTGALFAAVPAQADSSSFTYTVTNDSPVIGQWVDGICNSADRWLSSSARNAVTATATVSAAGDYKFSDRRIPADGRVIIFAGSYDPADVSNCLVEIDDTRSVTLETGVTYTLIQAGFAGSTGTMEYQVEGPGTITVTPALIATTTFLAVDAATVPAGAAVSLTGTVTSTGFESGLQGTAELFEGPTSLGTSPVNPDGSFALANVNLTPGNHQITAHYSGNQYRSPSVSAPVSLDVDRSPTSTVAVGVPNLIEVGQDTVLTATVTGHAPTGTVEFSAAGKSLGTTTLAASELGLGSNDSAAATLSIADLVVGTHTVIAAYSGDANHKASTSNPVTITATAIASTTIVAASETDIEFGGETVLTAEVTGHEPTGSIDFFASDAPLGTAPVIDGKATLSVTDLAVGKHQISAGYSGDLANSASHSHNALFISVTANPEPEPSPTPEPTPTPEATPTPEPTPTSTGSATPVPTQPVDTAPETEKDLAQTGASSQMALFGGSAIVLLVGGALVLRRKQHA